MQTELLTDFLHLFHACWPQRKPLAHLLEYFTNDPARVRRASDRALRAAGLDAELVARIRKPCDTQVARDLAWAEAAENRLLSCVDSAYPVLLREISDFPLLLYARGNCALLQTPQIAIVGSRHCTPGGAQNARHFAAELASSGLTVTSGLAFGIDAEAHRGALAADGNTIAVTGTGIDIVYPARNRHLAQTIVEQGLMLSEFPLGTPGIPANFPRRNRIISGMCLATLVVEAAQRSGSLITARLAAEQGREVYAIPGSIHNPQTRGCHQLIRDGARLALEPRDLVGELAELLGFVFSRTNAGKVAAEFALDDAQKRLLDVIGYDPVNCDTLVQRSGLTIEDLSSMLLLLELNDLIQSAPGGCFVRI